MFCTCNKCEYARRMGGAIVYTDFDAARSIRSAFPGSRIVRYQKGYAVQLHKSGPYVTREMRDAAGL